MMQDSLLLPWRTLSQNATLGAELLGIAGEQASAECIELFRQLGLQGTDGCLPEHASGGMQRRAALVRALLCKPSLLLLDEPFANLDFDVKLQAQRCLLRCHGNSNMAIVLVTHDVEDAISLADRVLVLNVKPTSVKTSVVIERVNNHRDPAADRGTLAFRNYYQRILEDLRYFNDAPGNE